MKTTLIAATAVLALSACTSHDYTFHGSLDFSAEERTTIEQAAADMATLTGGEPVAIEWDGVDGDRTIVREKLPGAIVGLEHPSNGGDRISLSPGLELSRLRIVMMHETGHYFGLRHTASGIMSPTAQDFFSSDDLAECRRAGLCNGS